MADNNSKFKTNIDALIGGMEGYLSTKTVVGEPVHVGENIIVPLADVSFGVGAGAFEGDSKNRGGGGMGAKITPSAMLLINGDGAKILSLKENPSMLEKLMEAVPGLISKFTKKGEKEEKGESAEEIFE